MRSTVPSLGQLEQQEPGCHVYPWFELGIHLVHLLDIIALCPQTLEDGPGVMAPTSWNLDFEVNSEKLISECTNCGVLLHSLH